MTWRTQLTLALALVCQVSASCSGKSSDCHNQYNFHTKTCTDKNSTCYVLNNKSHKMQLTPGPFDLYNQTCTPSGLIPVDGYTLSMQNFQGSTMWTLHGLWPESQYGHEGDGQPYGCRNGEEFNKTIFDNFNVLISHFWPTDQIDNQHSQECFIMSEWMKHGTCAVVPGRDTTAFRLSQEAYFRTAFVIANNFNENVKLHGPPQVKPHGQPPMKTVEPLITAQCVQCAYLATVDWQGYDVASVPRMSDDCIRECDIECDKTWKTNTCNATNLDSTVHLDPSNAPLRGAAVLAQEDEL